MDVSNMKRQCRVWTPDRIEQIRKDVEHSTLQKVADQYGISRQRVAQIAGPVYRERFIEKTYSVYPAIDKWMNENMVSYRKLIDMLGYAYSSPTHTRLKRILMGTYEPRKTQIDGILELTGLSYEEAFSLE